jgi:hypothetical protein
LVLEGGFLPEEIMPRPPFQARKAAGKGLRGVYILDHDESLGGTGERTVLGGLKTKSIDVVVSKNGVGPCLAISAKGTRKAFRNLTNRMEEAVGDCTNIHVSYPALVYGFWHILRVTRPGRIGKNTPGFLKPDKDGKSICMEDVSVTRSGEPMRGVRQYHDVMGRLTGRADLRSDPSRYEAVALLMVEGRARHPVEVFNTYPPLQSPLHSTTFFGTLLRQYDLRFVYGAPSLSETRRRYWHPESPALADSRAAEFNPRAWSGDDLAEADGEPEEYEQ